MPEIEFPNPERVWEKSQYGKLLRENVYFTLLPYIFAHHHKQNFKSATDYAAFEAYDYYLRYPQVSLLGQDEDDLRLSLMGKYKMLVETFRESIKNEEIGGSSDAFHCLVRKNAKPAAPSFDPVPLKRIKTAETKSADYYSALKKRERAIVQRETVARFCMLARDLHYIQEVKSAGDGRQRSELDDRGKTLAERFSKVRIPKAITRLQTH